MHGHYSTGAEEFIAVALKRLLPFDTEPWGSREKAVWCEGSRLAECQLQYAAFLSQAAAADISCTGSPDKHVHYAFTTRSIIGRLSWKFGRIEVYIGKISQGYQRDAKPMGKQSFLRGLTQDVTVFSAGAAKIAVATKSLARGKYVLEGVLGPLDWPIIFEYQHDTRSI
ncbi:hypothetical protein B0H10DRAFT_2192363 [Mycena sp. CBHHK59/15]|nr:hypothetical protein B0H10DRAFT_2192363 [Mycena sp. CBHHK59/15]